MIEKLVKQHIIDYEVHASIPVLLCQAAFCAIFAFVAVVAFQFFVEHAGRIEEYEGGRRILVLLVWLFSGVIVLAASVFSLVLGAGSFFMARWLLR